MRLWLIQDDVLEAMRDARSAIVGYEPTADERAQFLAAQIEARARRGGGGLPDNVAVDGQTATIGVYGTLTEEPDCFAMLFGGGNTTYAAIRDGIAAAEADQNVKDVVFDIKSPGGTVDGLFETIAAIEGMTKPARVVTSQAASAAYAIAAAAGPIEAKSVGTGVGSIGVATRMRKDPAIVDIASKEAPNKRPDVATEEGRGVVQAQLDAVHELFADVIARGRARVTGEAIDVAHVNSEFGRGSVLLAGEAKKKKMIDAMPRPVKRAPYAQAVANETASADDGGEAKPQESSQMDLNTLKTSHAAVYEAVIAEGAAAERKRVNAHMKMAEAAGDIKLALPFIASGVAVSDEDAFATYQSAAMTRNAQATRQAESDGAAAATAGAKTPAAVEAEAEDLGDRTVAALKAARPAAAKAAAK